MKTHPCESCNKPKKRRVREWAYSAPGIKLKRPVIFYACETCWFCPWCKRHFMKDEDCACKRCGICGMLTMFRCSCKPDASSTAVEALPLNSPVCMLCGERVQAGEWCGFCAAVEVFDEKDNMPFLS